MLAINFEQKKHLTAGSVTIFVALAVYTLLYVIPWNIIKPATNLEEMGMLVNLGDSDFGSGSEQPLSESLVSEISGGSTPTNETATNISNEINTQENEEAPELETPKKQKSIPVKDNKIELEKKKQVDVKELEKTRQQQINAKALADKKAKEDAFKNKLKGMMNKSNGVVNEGESTGTGDQGVQNGDPNASNHSGTNSGLGDAGNGWSINGLKGRTVRRKPIIQDNSREEGNISITITVDNNGNVTIATILEKKTTSTSVYLRNLAKKAAKEMKFNPKDELNDEVGIVIFKFRNK
jgi:outer membrane biosynthesis protein TonB